MSGPPAIPGFPSHPIHPSRSNANPGRARRTLLVFLQEAAGSMTVGLGIEFAREKDARDPLARFVGEFHLPPGRIYLDGNSLGPLSRRSEASTLRVLDDWKTRGIGGWLDGEPPWFTMAEELGAAMARLVG